MIGNSWWSDVNRRGEEPKLCPPRVVISISGEPAPQEGSIEWTTATGKAFDVSDPPTGTTYIGRCVGKQLFISDVDEKKKKVEALVKIMAPSSDDEPERVIGTFPSRPIKVISKPSKKRQSAKNLECESRPCRRHHSARRPQHTRLWLRPCRRRRGALGTRTDCFLLQCVLITAQPSRSFTGCGHRRSPPSTSVFRDPDAPSRVQTGPRSWAWISARARRRLPSSLGLRVGVCSRL